MPARIMVTFLQSNPLVCKVYSSGLKQTNKQTNIQTNKIQPFTDKLIRTVLLIVLKLFEAAAADAGRNNGHFPASYSWIKTNKEAKIAILK